MLNQALAHDALEAALSCGGDFAELFVEDRRSHSLSFQDNRLETVHSGRTHGAGIRVYVGLNAIYTYTNDTDRDGLLRCAKQAAAAVRDWKGGLTAVQPFYTPEIKNLHTIQCMKFFQLFFRAAHCHVQLLGTAHTAFQMFHRIAGNQGSF